MYLFFDTETTGLPLSWKASVTDLNNWPRMVQIAWIFCDKNGNRIASYDFLIKPINFEIPEEASKIHGISTQQAIDQGEDFKLVLNRFNEWVEQSNYIVAHNMRFDEKIVGAELLRMQITSSFNRKQKLCTMLSSIGFCGLPGKYGLKWPKLSELHIKLFGKDFDQAHNASADIDATEKCFWKMRKIGLI